MLVFRLVDPRFADLSGTGGMKVDGRWHKKGRRVLYAAQSQSLAILEKRVHLRDLPDELRLMKIEVPGPKHWETVKDLPPDWASQRVWTQAYGDRWLAEKRSVVLQVPSAIVPQEFNYLINPDHGEFARVKLRSVAPFRMDARLFRP